MNPRFKGAAVPQTFTQSLDLASFKTGDASASRNGFAGSPTDTNFYSGIYYGAPPCTLDNSAQDTLRSSTGRVRQFYTGLAGTGPQFSFAAFGGNGTNGDTMVSSTTFKPGDPNACWAWNMDTSTSTGAKRFNLWKDGAVDPSVFHFATGPDIAHLIDWTEGATPGWFLGCGAAHASPSTAIIGFLWVTNAYVDWGDPTIYAKWWDSVAGLKDPGADGSGYTGTAPILYLRMLKSDTGTAAANFLTNRGTGGDFTTQTTPLSAPYISYNGLNISGQIERFSKMQLAWGDSFTDITAATGQSFCVRRLVAQASGRDDFNGGKGGFPVRFVSGDASNYIQGYSHLWYGGASIDGISYTTALNGPIERRPGGTSTYADILCRMEGTYNDIHGGNWPSPGFSGTMAACAAMQTDWLTYGNGQPYYFVGPTNGGQSANPSATYLADNEEYGPPLGGVSGGPYYQYLQLLWDLSTGLKSIFGSLYFDTHDALVTNANDATIQPDGWPLGSLQIALAAGLIASVTANDLTDVTNNVVPRGLRSTVSVSGVTTAPGLTGINYGIHLINAGHFAHFVKEMRFKAALGIL